MSYLTTAKDLKLDALNIAGEPTDGTSDYDATMYDWLTVAQRTIVSGGMLGPSMLQPENWYWARAWPRGSMQLQQPYNAAETISATFTLGSTNVSVPSTVLPDLTGYRVLRSDTPARHIIDGVNNNAVPNRFTLREPWTGDTVTDANWLAYPDTYALPTDFVRGLSPLFLYWFPSNLPTTQFIDVIEPVDMERMYPQTFPWGGNLTATGGVPVLAARVNDTRIRFSHFLNTLNQPNPMQVEFEYIRRPPVIAEGVIPIIPIEHRRILAYGAAYLILNDKKNSDADSKFQMFTMQYKAMRDEHARDMRRMSSRWGVIQPARAAGNRSIMLTESGLQIYTW